MSDMKPIVLAYSDGLAFASFEADQVSNQADGTGLIGLTALRLRIRALAGQRKA